jgi:hypothetical protein
MQMAGAHQQVVVGRGDRDAAGLDRSPWRAWTTSRLQRRCRIAGSALVPFGGRCRTMRTAAGRSLGSPDTRALSASTPPADAPTTTMS